MNLNTVELSTTGTSIVHIVVRMDWLIIHLQYLYGKRYRVPRKNCIKIVSDLSYS